MQSGALFLPYMDLNATDLIETLLPLEKKLLAVGADCDRDCIESLLAEDFREFGTTGKVWDRASMVRELVRIPARRHRLSDVHCTPITHDQALLHYRTVVNGRESLRSSLWVHRDGRWQMQFHQGTRVPPKEAATGS